MALFGKSSRRAASLALLFLASSSAAGFVASEFPSGFDCAEIKEGTTGSAQRYIAAKPDVKSKVKEGRSMEKRQN